MAEIQRKKVKKRSQLKALWFQYKKNKLAMFGLILMSLMILTAVCAGFFLDYDTQVIGQSIRSRLQWPSAAHWFGTDQYGRDLFARVIWGSRISLFVGFFTVGIAMTVGSLIGAFAGYYGGRVDNILMRIMDVFLAIPNILMAITLVAAFGTSLFNLILAMGLAGTPKMSRIVRSAVLSIIGTDYIEAARACGTSDMRIIFRHILPNAMGPILVQATQTVARSVITVSSLSFIGLGISEPTPEWGAMLSAAKSQLRYHPYLAVSPGIAIVMVVVSLTLLGDGLRDAMDPRLKN